MTIDANTIHRIFGALGGKKFLAMLLGIGIWYARRHGIVIPPEILADPGVAAILPQAAASVDPMHLIMVYILSQGIADGLSGGATSSVAALGAPAEEKKT